MDLTTHRPTILRHGLITFREALAAGLEPRDIAALVAHGRWHRLRTGVYVDAGMWQALDPFREQPVLRIRAAHLVLRVPHVFSHDSAGILLGMGSPAARTARVHVTRADVRGSRTRAGITHHGAPYAPEHVTEVDGLPVLDATRTALDLARLHGPDHGLAACDAALRIGALREEMAARLLAMHHWPGIRSARAAVALVDPGAESWAESRGRWFVHELGIGTPETQFGIGWGGRRAWADLRVGRHLFEIDGFSKYPEGDAGRIALREEKRRQDFLGGFKLGVSRLTPHDFDAGRRIARVRVLREFEDTCDRFGSDIDDLAPYVLAKVDGRRPQY